MKKYGWFEFDPSPRKIVNYLTRQSLAITSSSDFSGGSSYDGHYSDHEISQPIRFLIRKAVRNVVDIELDYRESPIGCPDYGYWRRIDDFLVDALLCWPEFLDQQVIFRLNTVGGWRCGVWTPELKRQFSGRKSGTPDQMAKYPIAEPYIISLDTPVPMTWRHVDLVTPATKASFKFELLMGNDIPYLLSLNGTRHGHVGMATFRRPNRQEAHALPKVAFGIRPMYLECRPLEANNR